MNLLTGINHTALLSADVGRLAAFYVRVFGARAVLDMTEGDLRIMLIDVGGGATLAAFQREGTEVPRGGLPEFARGRHDHVALNAADEQAFRELRRRLVAEGASDGVITDVGPAQQFGFTDPDGWESEVLWMKPGDSWVSHLPPAEWLLVEAD
ncbi:MAG TPA: VOC family protein [Pseudonocardia sp.]|jgi:catechol 2,3-dioxygenase-like lactoylglutathione lyase family enzyme|nr:VOC family protein [Pseudonocardia sp.]